jgi:glycosyltransferase involved in cell wall biosynthesis
MRIAHVTDFYLPRLGGIETHIAGLADRQRRIGHDVDVISVDGVVETTAGTSPTARRSATLASFRPQAIAGATSAVMRGEYDVVHVHAGLATPLAFATARIASRAGLPTVVTVHSVVGGMAPIYRAADTVALWSRWPVVWTAVSEMAAAPMRRLLGGNDRVSVLPNAVDAGEWVVDRSTPVGPTLRVTAVMRLARRKRPMELLRALRAVRASVPADVSISVVVIGDGGRRRSMERYLARHDMCDWVTLPGRLGHPEIREVFRHTDVFVAPAIQESFGIAALEARAAGIPIVAMERAGIREFVEHGRDGLLVADDAGLVSALKLLATDRSSCAAIAAHNARVPAPFGWPEALARTTSAYEGAAALQHARLTTTRRPARMMAAGGLPITAATNYREVTT